MLGIIIAVIKIVAVLGIIILIHELGHFLVAKKCGIKVNQFAIGFGPKIWSKEKNETKYTIRLIPLGGFVSMEGEEERSESDDAFNKKSIPKRMAVLVAGALVNIVFAIIVYFIFTNATGYYKYTIQTNVASSLENGYAADIAGVLPNDKILKINNKKITTNDDVNKVLAKNQGEEVEITIDRDGEILTKPLVPTLYTTRSMGFILRNK